MTEHCFFMTTERIGFSKWGPEDLPLARLLWGDPEVTHFISKNGGFSEEEIAERLRTEIKHESRYGIQYWPIFALSDEDLIGCCGLRPCPEDDSCLEIGTHLRKKYWRQGLACEAARAVIDDAASMPGISRLQAGHHPLNEASRDLLARLGFEFTEDRFYAPTGLYHPTYTLRLQNGLSERGQI